MQNPPPRTKQAQVTSPTACGAFSCWGKMQKLPPPPFKKKKKTAPKRSRRFAAHFWAKFFSSARLSRASRRSRSSISSRSSTVDRTACIDPSRSHVAGEVRAWVAWGCLGLHQRESNVCLFVFFLGGLGQKGGESNVLFFLGVSRGLIPKNGSLEGNSSLLANWGGGGVNVLDPWKEWGSYPLILTQIHPKPNSQQRATPPPLSPPSTKEDPKPQKRVPPPSLASQQNNPKPQKRVPHPLVTPFPNRSPPLHLRIRPPKKRCRS